MLDKQLIGRVKDQGQKPMSELKERFGIHPHIADIRGRGLFIGMEFVANRESKAPFWSEEARHKCFKAEAFDVRLICYPMGVTLDRRRGDYVLIAPPFIISGEQIRELCDKLEWAVTVAPD